MYLQNITGGHMFKRTITKFKYSLYKKKRKLCILFDNYSPLKDNHFIFNLKNT